MTPSSPPSFDTLFDNQQNGRESPGNSTTDYNQYGYPRPPFNTTHPHQLGGDFPLTDEPPPLSRHGSHDGHLRGRTESLADRVKGVSMNDGRGGPFKQDSLQFDFESSSTLIATAPRGSNRPSPGQNDNGHSDNIGETVFAPSPQHASFSADGQYQFRNQQWDMAGNDGYGQYAGLRQDMANRANPFPSNEAPFSGMGLQEPHPSNSGDNSFLYNQHSQFPAAVVTPNQPIVDGAWSHDFLGQGNGAASLGGGQERRMSGASWSSGNGMDHVLSVDDQEQLHELERIISNASSPGSQYLSREPTPIDQGDFTEFGSTEEKPEVTPDTNSAFKRSDSMSRSASPLPQVYDQPVSPPAFGGFHHATGSPLRKPQSPPALIILNQPSPSPSLPPILTTTAASGSNNARGGVQQPVRNSSSGGGGAGGLLPPANPALEHFTGMAGISPIGPSTDGPMIYIQPSTPISGLKDGRGVFEAAIRRAGANGPQDRQGRNQKGRPQGQQSGQQRDDFNVPPPASHPLLRNASGDQYTLQSNQASGVDQQNNDFNAAMQFPNAQEWGDLRPSGQMRPRAKSDSFMGASASDLFDRQMLAMAGNPQQGDWAQAMQPGIGGPDLRSTIDNWRAALIGGQDEQQVPNPTLDPRTLPGNQDESAVQDFLQQLQVSQQYSRLQAQRSRLPSLNTNTATTQSGVFQYKPGEFSPTSLAFYQQLGINPTNASQLAGTSSAPYSQSNFQNVPQNAWPQTAIPAAQSFLTPDQPGLGPRRRSFAEGTNHPASGAGTPGYGMGFTTPLSLNPARLRAGSPGVGHRRAVQSEDLGRGGAGWGMAGAGSTCVAFMVYKRFKAEDPLSTDFLNSITANDGTLLPPSRGRSNSHSRQSSGSSVRSVSPALSISSQGSSYSHHSPRMDMDDPGIPQRYQENRRKKVAKMKVTSVATEVASSSRRTNDGVFVCPIPGCGSTFTRHFNLKGHLRSHNDERPYKCLYDGCPKAAVGFARQHDCKRHMLLHEGLRPFECEGCGKKFARLDALTRHRAPFSPYCPLPLTFEIVPDKSEQGQECAITHPLPVNPDGSPMSELQYKIYRQQQGGRGGMGGFKREPNFLGYPSGDDRSEQEDMDLGNGSGMEEYDRF